MNNYLIWIIIFALSSCSMDNPRIEIKNNTKDVITDLEFGIDYGNMNKIDSLLSGKSFSSKIIFDDSIIGDGSYILKYNINDVQKVHSFGYFTNGKSMNSRITVNIETDTVKYSYY